MRFCIPLTPGSPGQRPEESAEVAQVANAANVANVAKVGGKARSLQRLAAAGLPTPPAFVVTTALYAALRAAGPELPPALTTPDALAALARAAGALAETPWPAGFTDELAAALAALAPEDDARFAVRSSATIEDQAGTLAPGLFSSVLGVPRGDVPAAVRAVLGSALAPGVAAYLDGRGGSARVGVAVLIHRFVAGDAAGAVAFDPTTLAAPLVEVHAGNDGGGDGNGGLTGGARAQIADAARTLAAAYGPVEIEWVARGDRPIFLQLRPYQASPQAAWPGADQLASGGDGHGSWDPGAAAARRSWRWDAAHNPLPLSPAQAGLVALVDERCQIGIRQQVVDGYLFYAPDVRAPAADVEPPILRAPEALRTLQEVAAAMLTQPAPTLEDALTNFATIYEPLYGDVQPAARAARAALPAFLRQHGLDPAPRLPALLSGVASAASDRMRCARALAGAGDLERRANALAIYLALFGDEGPRWDVAAPTWRESPAALERLLLGAKIDLPSGSSQADDAAAAVRELLPDDARAEWEARLAEARAAVAVAEDDDVLYARLQAHVRRALLREGQRLQAAGLLADAEDVFWLPLDDVRADARGDAPLTADGVARSIVTAFRADQAARASPPPLELSGREPVTAPLYAGEVVRGISGSGGARIGRVRLHGEGTTPPGPTEVLVARTLLPTELPLVAPSAIVVETGGALDHVAAQARERGIPAVVGAAGATQMLRDGDEILVDADAGLVVRLAGRSV